MTERIIACGGSAHTSDCPILIEFLLDETTSMNSCKQGVVTGFNKFIEEQRRQSGTCFFTLTKFSTSHVFAPYVDLDVNMVPAMDHNMFNPAGGTNLRDTIGDRINQLRRRLESWTTKPNILFVIMTDGEDTSSRTFDEPSLRSLVEAHEALGWTFAYLGATANAITIAHRLGFKNAKRFEVNDVQEVMTSLAKSTTVYRTTRDATTTTLSDTSFFSR